MTLTDIETWDLTIPDEVVPCYVYTSHPWICPESIAAWMVQAKRGIAEYALCDGCKSRWQSYGNVSAARRL